MCSSVGRFVQPNHQSSLVSGTDESFKCHSKLYEIFNKVCSPLGGTTLSSYGYNSSTGIAAHHDNLIR
jgi:hypothetical protein